MKRTVLILLVIFTLFLATPALADNPQPVGERINLVYPVHPPIFPENQPFHIVHGIGGAYSVDPEILQLYGFTLEVDGELIEPTARYIQTLYDEDGNPFAELNTSLYNFPDGMTGPHRFTYHFYVPCDASIKKCTPGTSAEWFSKTVPIVFK